MRVMPKGASKNRNSQIFQDSCLLGQHCLRQRRREKRKETNAETVVKREIVNKNQHRRPLEVSLKKKKVDYVAGWSEDGSATLWGTGRENTAFGGRGEKGGQYKQPTWLKNAVFRKGG